MSEPMRRDGLRPDPAVSEADAGLRRGPRPSKIYLQRVPAPTVRQRAADRLLVLGFLAAITLPLLGMLMHWENGVGLEENRSAAPLPTLRLKRRVLAAFPAQFEAYFNDHFGFRERLIHWLNYTKVAGLGVSPSPKVIVGSDGWLFYGDIELPCYRAIEPLSPDGLAQWQKLIETRRDWLAARGIPYLFVIAPNKSTIYPEHMPVAYNRVHEESRLDQLMAYMKQHSTVRMLDLREPLRAAKSREQVYYRTDSHWNYHGAYAGYTAIVTALAEWFPGMRPVPRDQFKDRQHIEPGRDLSMMLGLRDYYSDTYQDIETPVAKIARIVPQPAEVAKAPGRKDVVEPDTVYEAPTNALPRAVMIRDSFGTWLFPLLADHFSRITFSRQYTFDPVLIEKEHPDVVIQEMVERNLTLPAETWMDR